MKNLRWEWSTKLAFTICQVRNVSKESVNSYPLGDEKCVKDTSMPEKSELIFANVLLFLCLLQQFGYTFFFVLSGDKV